MTERDIFHKDTEYIAHTYQRFSVAVRCGHGATAEDFEGNAAIRSLPLKILSMEGLSLHWRAVDNSVCGIMVELVQGEGGVTAIDKSYAKYVEEVSMENGILFLVDEVQTGIGRTGTFLCSEQYHIRPNIITLAKGLGGGLPIGAVLMDDVAGEVLGPGQHGSTFGGNPVVCAGGIEVLDQICREGFLSDVSAKADYLCGRLRTMPGVTGISGMGLMIGISVDEGLDARKVAERCAKNGLLILTAKKKLRIMPPLNITLDEIDKGLNILSRCLSEI